MSLGPNGEKPEAGLDGHADRRGTGQDQGHERQGGDRHALCRQRLVAGADRGPEGAVRQDGHRGGRHHRCRLQARQAGLRHRDRDGAEAQHHRLDPDRSGRHRRGLQGGRRRRAPSSCSWTTCRRASSPARTTSAPSRPTITATASPPAHLLAQALGGKGDVGLVFHAADFFVTKQRYDAVKKTLAENYPDIKIVAEQGIGGPDFSGDAEKAAGAMLVVATRASRASGRCGTCRPKA